ncbi:hypothetical protein [Paraburkholderia terrae]|uniref:hypothetical protein n=1 Tax=Paraburkholderia terrae TaxID=311230 RepID=UPI001EE261B5|nr:hypothetical protein [Paraburkholderia terrae]GJH02274.1 hypothetical protein CBA19C8_16975 [Paraburkholderia terrae]
MTATIEDMKKTARELGGAAERAHGMKVSVSFEAMSRSYTWFVDNSLANEAFAAEVLEAIREAQSKPAQWTASIKL